jgi:Protein of unknown function (DUF2970)
LWLVRGFIAAVLAVLSAFVGIRKRSKANADQQIKPLQLVAAALLCVIVLVVLIVSLVRFVIGAASH